MIDVGNSSKRDARKIDIALRREKLLVLRRNGATYEQCARALGLSNKAHAQAEFKKALGEILAGESAEYRKMAEMRFDDYRTRLSKQIAVGDVQAIDTARKIEMDQARILGYVAPVTAPQAGTLVTPEVMAELRRASEEASK